MIIDTTQTAVVPKTHAIFRLKNDFIVLYNIAKDEFFQIRNGNDVFNIVGFWFLPTEAQKENGFWILGDDHFPSLWNRKIYVDKTIIAYELRFRPGDFVKNSDGHLMKICSIPSNCGYGDYGRWKVLENGKMSGSGQERDPDLDPASRKRKKR